MKYFLNILFGLFVGCQNQLPPADTPQNIKTPILLWDGNKDKSFPQTPPIADFTITPHQAYSIVWSNYDICQLSRKVVWACHYDENYYYISDAFFGVKKGEQIKKASCWIDGRTGEIVLPSNPDKRFTSGPITPYPVLNE